MSPVPLCPRCGAAVPPGAGQCPACGAPLGTGVPSGHTTERVLPPGTVPAPGHPGPTQTGPATAAFAAQTLPGFPTRAPSPAGPVGAPLGRRVLAWLIDAIIVGIPAAIAYAAMLPGVLDKSADAADGTTSFTPSDLFPLIGLAWGLTLVAGLVLVSVEGVTGRTPGKLALGLRTGDVETGRPIGVGRGIVRGLVFGAFALACYVGELLVLLSPVFDASPRRQGWHDKAARAMVVRVPAAAAVAGPRPPAPAPAVATVPPASMTSAPAAPYAGVPPFTPAPYAPAPYDAAPGAGSLGGPTAPSSRPGLITGVPGVTSPAVPAAPAWTGGLPAPQAPPAPAPAMPGPVPSMPSAAPGIELELPDGSAVRVTGRALLGRDPAVPPSSTGPAPLLVAVPDPGRSVSKTHAEVGVDGAGLWLVDRGSTNGTTVEVPGAAPLTAAPGQQVRVPAGATVRLGDAAVLVRGDGSDVLDESTVISVRRPPSGGGSW